MQSADCRANRCRCCPSFARCRSTEGRTSSTSRPTRSQHRSAPKRGPGWTNWSLPRCRAPHWCPRPSIRRHRSKPARTSVDRRERRRSRRSGPKRRRATTWVPWMSIRFQALRVGSRPSTPPCRPKARRRCDIRPHPRRRPGCTAPPQSIWGNFWWFATVRPTHRPARCCPSTAPRLARTARRRVRPLPSRSARLLRRRTFAEPRRCIASPSGSTRHRHPRGRPAHCPCTSFRM